jgi:hypothetical protein
MTNTKNLTIGQNTYPTVKVGDHSFANIPVSDFITLPPAPVQRNSHMRVSKMKPIFDNAYTANQSHTLTEVAIGVVVTDFDDIDPDTQAVIGSYKAGEVSIIDGATRKHYWIRYPQQALLTPEITAKIHYLSSMDDVNFAYYPYNSKESVEKTNQLLQGLARRYQWQARQPMFANGSYKTALDWATSRPGDKGYADVAASFNFNFDELKVLDTLPKNGGPSITKPTIKGLKSQSIIAAALIALKYYPNNVRLFQFIDNLANISMDDLRNAIALGDLTAVEVVAAEYSGMSKTRGNGNKPSWLNDMAGSTNFASKEPQLDFLLYWMIEYIQDPNKKLDFDRGVKPAFWENAWSDLVADAE